MDESSEAIRRDDRTGRVFASNDLDGRATLGIRGTEWNPSLPGSWFQAGAKVDGGSHERQTIMNSMHVVRARGLSMNRCSDGRLSSRPTSAPGKAPIRGSWSQCAAIFWDWRLSMNRREGPRVAVPKLGSAARRPSQIGSWSRCATIFWDWGLPINRGIDLVLDIV